MRPDRIGLKDHADLALFGRGADAPAARITNLAVERDLAFVRLFETRDAAQKRRLARAARPEQDKKFPASDFEIDRLHRRDHAIAGKKFFAQAGDRDHPTSVTRL